MRSLRAALYPLRLVGARLGRRSAPVVLVVLGIAAGAAVVIGGRAGALVAQDRAVAQAVERIPDGQRSVRAVWFGLPGLGEEAYPKLDARARDALATVGVARPTPLVLFRETTVAGTFAGLGGVENLDRWVTLRSGRLPRACTPERCEVLRLRGQGRLPHPDGLNLVEVGEAVLDNRVLFGDFLPPTDNALAEAEVSPSLARAAGYHRPPPPPLFLAEGVDALATAPALDRIFRSYAWVSPLRAGAPRLWQIDDLAAHVAKARSELQSGSFSFDLLAPVEELREAQATTRAAGRRLGVVGGEAAALLFAFALLAAMTLRPDLLATRRRLAWYGARGWQLALVTVAESAALAVLGTAIGLVVGLLGGAVVARASRRPGDRRAHTQRPLRRRDRARDHRGGRGDRRPRRRRGGAVLAGPVRPPRRRRGRCGRARRPRGHARRRRRAISRCCCRRSSRSPRPSSSPGCSGRRSVSSSGSPAAARSGSGSHRSRSPATRATRSRPRLSSSSASGSRSSPRATGRRWPAANATRRRTRCRSTTSSAKTCGG